MSWWDPEPDYRPKKPKRKIRSNAFKRDRRMKRQVNEGRRFTANRYTLKEMALADVKAMSLYRHGQTIPAPQRGRW